jgi:hypothetical protein
MVSPVGDAFTLVATAAAGGGSCARLNGGPAGDLQDAAGAASGSGDKRCVTA